MQQGSLLLAIDTLIVYMFQVLYFKAVERGWLKKWYYGDVLVYAVSCGILFHAVSLCEPNPFHVLSVKFSHFMWNDFSSLFSLISFRHFLRHTICG